MILILGGVLKFFDAVFFSSIVYHGPESDSVHFLKLTFPRQCSIFCSCCKKHFHIFNKEWNLSEPVCILPDQLLNGRQFFRTSSQKQIARKSFSKGTLKGLIHSCLGGPCHQLPASPQGSQPSSSMTCYIQEPRVFCGLYFQSP